MPSAGRALRLLSARSNSLGAAALVDSSIQSLYEFLQWGFQNLTYPEQRRDRDGSARLNLLEMTS